MRRLDFFSVAPRPADEQERQRALDRLDVVDTPGDPALDRIVADAAVRFDTPIAAVSLVDRDRQWFMAKVGVDATETPRAYSFCAHAAHEADGVLVVPDAAEDLRFRANPLVAGAPHIRFYAGAVLTASNGQPLGALCVIDSRPHQDLSLTERNCLLAFASEASRLLQARG